MEHKILSASRTDTLNALITQYIEDGWRIYGNLSCMPQSDRDYSQVMQAMVKIEPNENLDDLIVPINRLSTVE